MRRLLFAIRWLLSGEPERLTAQRRMAAVCESFARTLARSEDIQTREDLLDFICNIEPSRSFSTLHSWRNS